MSTTAQTRKRATPKRRAVTAPSHTKRRAALIAAAQQARAELAASGFKFRSADEILAELAVTRG